MYAVIFKAELNVLDAEYHQMAERMRQLATDKYGCLGVSSLAADGQEITLSYWPSLKHIERWKADPEHLQAQARGRSRWYKSYAVQVAHVQREYRSE